MKKLVTFRSPFTRLNASATRLAWVPALIVLNAVFCAGQGPPNTDGWVVLSRTRDYHYTGKRGR